MLEIFTFGDSWTNASILQYPETEQYGAVIAKRLNASCSHNYGVSGGSNSGMLNLLEENLDQINSVESALVILTFTENARDIDCYSERQYDYISAYKDSIFDYDFYDKVLDDIEQEWIERLDLIKFADTVTVVAGFNFVWHPKLAEYCKSRFILISPSWMQLLGWEGSMPRTTRVTALETIYKLTNTPIDSNYKRWTLDQMHLATDVFNWARKNQYFQGNYADRGHPDKNGHIIWAERILCEL